MSQDPTTPDGSRLPPSLLDGYAEFVRAHTPTPPPPPLDEPYRVPPADPVQDGDAPMDAPKFAPPVPPPNDPPRIALPAPGDDDDDPGPQQGFNSISGGTSDNGALAQEVARLKALVYQLMHAVSERSGLRPPIFLSRVQSGGAFNEVATQSGNITDYIGGRTSNGSDTFGVKIPPLMTQTTFALFDGNQTNYFAAADRAVVVKITGNASGGGKYNGRVITGNCTATASGNLSAPEGFTVPSSDDALVLNWSENGASTHNVNTGQFFNGMILGMTTDSPPKYKVAIGTYAGPAINVPLTFGTASVPLTFGTTSVPLTFNTASIPTSYNISATCSGGNVTITLSSASTQTVLTGVASSTNVYSSIATTTNAYNSTATSGCVISNPGACP